MTAVVIGVIFIGVGGWGILHWWTDFLTVVKGFLPLSLFIGGAVALIAGLAALNASSSSENEKG